MGKKKYSVFCEYVVAFNARDIKAESEEEACERVEDMVGRGELDIADKDWQLHSAQAFEEEDSDEE